MVYGDVYKRQGSTVALALRWGAARGVYSNEAGFGSAPSAHATAEVDHPIRQAVWGVFEAVSYTHLDVYKRQCLRRRLNIT